MTTQDTPFSNRKFSEKNEALRLANRDNNKKSESMRYFEDSFINNCF